MSDKDKSGWYLGKNWDSYKQKKAEAQKPASTPPPKEKEAWYPGKIYNEIKDKRTKEKEAVRIHSTPIDNSIEAVQAQEAAEASSHAEATPPSDSATPAPTAAPAALSAPDPSSTTTTATGSTAAAPATPSSASSSTSYSSSASFSSSSSNLVATSSSGSTLGETKEPPPTERKEEKVEQSSPEKAPAGLRQRVKAKFMTASTKRLKDVLDPAAEDDGKEDEIVFDAPTPTGEAVGKLTVRILAARSLPKRRKPIIGSGLTHIQRNASVKTVFENQTRRTNTIQQEANPSWEKDETAKYTFDVHDVTANLNFQVIDSRRLQKESIVGQAFISLATLLTIGTQDITTSRWLELFPKVKPTLADTTGNRICLAEVGINGTAMTKPTHCLGYLHVWVELKLFKPAHISYFLSEQYEYPAPEHLDPIVLRRNVARLKRAFGTPEWVLFLKEVTSWNDLPLSVGGLSLFLYLCLYGRAWQYILVTLALILISSQRSRSKKYKAASPLIWDSETGYDANANLKAMEKLKKVKKIVIQLQVLLGRIASHMERTSNLFNFADAAVTTLFLGVIFGVGLTLALIVAIIPPQFIVALLGLFVFLKPLVIKEGEQQQGPPKFIGYLKHLLSHVPDEIEYNHAIVTASASADQLPHKSLLGLPAE